MGMVCMSHDCEILWEGGNSYCPKCREKKRKEQEKWDKKVREE